MLNVETFKRLEYVGGGYFRLLLETRNEQA